MKAILIPSISFECVTFVIGMINQRDFELIFSADAETAWDRFHDEFEEITGNSFYDDTISTIFGKSPQHLTRLSAIIEVVNLAGSICSDIRGTESIIITKEIQQQVRTHVDRLTGVEIHLDSVNDAARLLEFFTVNKLIFCEYDLNVTDLLDGHACLNQQVFAHLEALNLAAEQEEARNELKSISLPAVKQFRQFNDHQQRAIRFVLRTTSPVPWKLCEIMKITRVSSPHLCACLPYFTEHNLATVTAFSFKDMLNKTRTTSVVTMVDKAELNACPLRSSLIEQIGVPLIHLGSIVKEGSGGDLESSSVNESFAAVAAAAATTEPATSTTNNSTVPEKSKTAGSKINQFKLA